MSTAPPPAKLSKMLPGFAIWDTRVQDFQLFVTETGYQITSEMWSHGKSIVQRKEGATWAQPGFTQKPTNPVVGVDWDGANEFCSWLTKREHASKALPAELHYRLPTDAEWSVAVGLDHEGGATPEDKSGKITGVYPWGTKWPPPRGAGNYAGKEAANRIQFAWASDYEDSWIFTSPVGSFDANKYGLYDMGARSGSGARIGTVRRKIHGCCVAGLGTISSRPATSSCSRLIAGTSPSSDEWPAFFPPGSSVTRPTTSDSVA